MVPDEATNVAVWGTKSAGASVLQSSLLAESLVDGGRPLKGILLLEGECFNAKCIVVDTCESIRIGMNDESKKKEKEEEQKKKNEEGYKERRTERESE